MSHFTDCIDGLIDADGQMTVYGCDGDKIRCQRATPSKQYTVKLSLPHHTVDDGAAIAAVYEPPCEARPDGTRHVFFTQRGGKLGHLIDPGGKDDHTLSSSDVQDGPKSLFGVFGAAAHAAGVIVLGFKEDDSQSLYWIFCSWDDLAAGNFDDAGHQTLDLGQVVSSSHKSDDDSELRFVLVTDASGQQSAVVYETLKHNNWHVQGQVIAVDSDGNAGQITALSFDDSSSHHPWSLQVLQQPWGEVYATWMTQDDPTQYTLAVTESIATTPSSASSAFPEQSEDGHATFSGWLPGTPDETTSTANPHLTDVVVPLYGITVCVDDDSYSGKYAKSAVGSLRRRALSVEPATKLNLLGIIAGPPPVPKENLDMPTNYDGFSPNLVPADGWTEYASQVMDGGQLSINWGVAFYGQTSQKFSADEEVKVFGFTLLEAKAYTQIKFSLELGYQGLYEDVTQQTMSTQYQCVVKMQGQAPGPTTPGDYEVDPLGGLVVAHTTWTGYTYEYLDQNGQTVDGGLAFSTLFPDTVDLDFLPFVLNPDTYCTPGELLSYARTQEELNAFDSKATQLADGSRRLSNAWAVNERMTSQSTAYAASTWTNGFTVDTDDSIEVGGEGGIFGASGGSSYTVGGKATFGLKYAQTKADSVGVGSQMTCRGNIDAPGTYTHYQWFTYQLESSSEWLEQLLDSLITPSFPAPNSNAYTLNQDLKDRIDPDSQPWLITYALGEYSKV